MTFASEHHDLFLWRFADLAMPTQGFHQGLTVDPQYDRNSATTASFYVIFAPNTNTISFILSIFVNFFQKEKNY